MDRNNNFNLIRLVAAFGVLFFHVYPLTGLEHDPLSFTRWLNFGSLSVRVFFIVSGFLLADSLLRNPNILTFAVARILRIWPALIAVTLFTVFAIGPSVTTDPTYWSHPATFDYLRSGTIFQTRSLLPGVFATNPVPVVNGSLWTLPYEVFCYAALAASFVMLKQFRLFMVAICGFCCWVLLTGRGVQTPIVANVLVLFTCELGAFFSAGAVLRLFRFKGHVALDALAIGALGLGLWFGQTDWKPFFVAQMVAIPYLVIRLAYVPYRPFGRVLDKVDISYGVYLYSFPMTQVVVTYLGKEAGVPITTLVATLVTLPLAVASWFLVEKPALALRGYLRNRRKAPQPETENVVPQLLAVSSGPEPGQGDQTKSRLAA